MDKKYLLAIARESVAAAPAVRPHLSMRTRYALAVPAWKTTDYFLATLTRAVKDVYSGLIGGDFVDILGSLIKGQVRQAYSKAWTDDGGDMPLPEWLNGAMVDAQESQANFDYIYGYYKDIIDARVDGTPIDPLLSRVQLWAARYDEEYNSAVISIELKNGGRLMWVYSPEKDHCPECERLNGIVAFASEWESLGVRPQSAPNSLLTCGGWLCGCELKATDKRRSPKAFESIMDIVSK